MNHVYGPVPSRRLGQSLGIDPIPFKTCNWNCVYCQLGRTSRSTNIRREYFPTEEIFTEIEAALKRGGRGKIDWLTIVGSGEPTLHTGVGSLIKSLKETAAIPIAVITNGSLLSSKRVRKSLLAADAVSPSLDAGNEQLYRRINRPLPELGFDRFVNGLVAFRREFDRPIWIETMLVKGLNDSDKALGQLASVLRRIRPDEVHLNVPERPPCLSWVEPPSADRLERAVQILGNIAHLVRPEQGQFDLCGDQNPVNGILQIISRHPMSEEELFRTLSPLTAGEITSVLQQLRVCGHVQPVTRRGKRFWTCAAAQYANGKSKR